MNNNLSEYLEQPIFLHAVNQELHNAIGRTIDTDNLLHSIRLFSLLSCQTMFCNVSQVYEVFYNHPAALLELTELAKLGRFIAHSDYGSLAEFQESREEKFHHSKRKHPAFFEEPSSFLYELPHSSMGLSVSTTGHIESELRGWIDNNFENSLNTTLSQNDKKSLRKNEKWLDNVLDNRDQKALTFDVFEQAAIGPFSHNAEGAIRRALTEAYIDSYVTSFDARCIWGYTGINHFERFSLLTGLNYKFGQAVVIATGLDAIFQSEPQYGQYQRLVIEHSEEMAFFRQCYAELASNFDEESAPNDTWDVRNAKLISNIQKIKKTGLLGLHQEDEDLSQKLVSAATAIKAINSDIFNKSTADISRIIVSIPPIKNKRAIEEIEVSTAPMQSEGKNISFLASHNFLVASGGIVVAIIAFYSLPLAFDLSSKQIVIFSLIFGLIFSGLVYWFHPSFYYRRMALIGLGVSFVGNLSYNLRISGISFFGDSRFEFGTLSSTFMIFAGLFFSMFCMILDFKQGNHLRK